MEPTQTLITPAAEPTDIKARLYENQFPSRNVTPEQQARYLGRYSVGALVMSFFYYQAMRDRLLAWLSILVSIAFFLSPLLLIFPFWARRRAYQSRTWRNFGEFESNQKKWDRVGLYSLLALAVLLFLAFRLLTPLLLNGFAQINPGLTNTDSSNYIDQLNQTKDSLQQILGD